MTINVDFSLLGRPANPGQALIEGFNQGRAQRREMETDAALAAHAQGDPDALRRLERWNPQLAAQIEQRDYQRSERTRATETRSALSDYIRTGMVPNAKRELPSSAALAGLGQPAAVPAPGIAATQSALAGYAAPSQRASNALAAAVPGGMPPMGALEPQSLMPSGFDGAEQAPTHRSDPRQEAFARLAQADPETALKVQKMDVEQRAAVAEALGKQLDIGGRVYSAVLQAAPEDQAAVYRQMRVELESAGVIDLPDEWDPAAAKSRMRLGMTVMQAVSADDRVRRTDWAIEDAIYDNERADRSTDSLIANRQDQIANRGARLGLARQRENRIASTPRGSGRSPAPRAPTLAGEVAPIIAKVKNGEPLTPGEERAWNMYRAPGRSGRGNGGTQGGNPPRIKTQGEYNQLKPGTTYIAPDGTLKRKAG